jgi:hypothetical protein
MKFYISSDDIDIKGSKCKGKIKRRKKASDGTTCTCFNESFQLAVPSKVSGSSIRLQITVWDHARTKANECVGGMSFTLDELACFELAPPATCYLLPQTLGRFGNITVDDLLPSHTDADNHSSGGGDAGCSGWGGHRTVVVCKASSLEPLGMTVLDGVVGPVTHPDPFVLVLIRFTSKT